MQSLILDTNVVVSGLLSKNSPPSLILDELVLNRRVEICTSDEIMAEYLEVLRRDKFARYPDFITRAEFLLHHLHQISLKYTPDTQIDLVADKDDNRFLELAIAAQADFLITGNTSDFTMKAIGQTQIVTPREYYQLYWPAE